MSRTSLGVKREQEDEEEEEEVVEEDEDEDEEERQGKDVAAVENNDGESRDVMEVKGESFRVRESNVAWGNAESGRSGPESGGEMKGEGEIEVEIGVEEEDGTVGVVDGDPILSVAWSECGVLLSSCLGRVTNLLSYRSICLTC